MEMKRVLELAYFGALEIWVNDEKQYKEFPDEFFKAKVEKAWNEVQEISEMLKAEEEK